MAYAPQRSKGLMSFLPEKYVYIPIRFLFVDPKTAIMFINYIILRYLILSWPQLGFRNYTLHHITIHYLQNKLFLIICCCNLSFRSGDSGILPRRCIHFLHTLKEGVQLIRPIQLAEALNGLDFTWMTTCPMFIARDSHRG